MCEQGAPKQRNEPQQRTHARHRTVNIAFLILVGSCTFLGYLERSSSGPRGEGGTVLAHTTPGTCLILRFGRVESDDNPENKQQPTNVTRSFLAKSSVRCNLSRSIKYAACANEKVHMEPYPPKQVDGSWRLVGSGWLYHSMHHMSYLYYRSPMCYQSKYSQ